MTSLPEPFGARSGSFFLLLLLFFLISAGLFLAVPGISDQQTVPELIRRSSQGKASGAAPRKTDGWSLSKNDSNGI